LLIPLKEGIGGERRPKERVTLRIILIGTKQPEKFLEQKVKKIIIKAKKQELLQNALKF
jgi:hypothetical protein